MVFKSRRHHSASYGYQTFAENKEVLLTRFGSDMYDVLKELGEVLEEKYSCDELVFNNWTGSHEYFMVIIKKEGEDVCYFYIRNKRYGLRELFNPHAEGVLDKQVVCESQAFFNLKNSEIYRNQLNLCGICEENEIEIDVYEDYKKSGTQKLVGSWEKIVDDYVTYNDRMRYCNGCNWRFADENVEKLYSMFISLYDGNYFLDNAVKRGVTID